MMSSRTLLYYLSKQQVTRKRYGAQEPAWTLLSDEAATLPACQEAYKALDATAKRMEYRAAWFSSVGDCQLFQGE